MFPEGFLEFTMHLSETHPMGGVPRIWTPIHIGGFWIRTRIGLNLNSPVFADGSVAIFRNSFGLHFTHEGTLPQIVTLVCVVFVLFNE